MRKFLITIALLFVLVVAIAAAWIFRGREISLWLDRSGTIESASVPVMTVSYKGDGSGGTIHLNDLVLSLSLPDPHADPPHMGTTKDEQFALSFGGKVFPFGPLKSGDDTFAINVPSGDDASLSIRHSRLSWPDLKPNFMTGQSPSWKRHLYYRLNWKKADGQKLEMLWRFEQYFYPQNGWAAGSMTRENSTGLIRVDIEK